MRRFPVASLLILFLLLSATVSALTAIRADGSRYVVSTDILANDKKADYSYGVVGTMPFDVFFQDQNKNGYLLTATKEATTVQIGIKEIRINDGTTKNIITASNKKGEITKNIITYPEVFGKNTNLSYRVKADGVKELIYFPNLNGIDTHGINESNAYLEIVSYFGYNGELIDGKEKKTAQTFTTTKDLTIQFPSSSPLKLMNPYADSVNTHVNGETKIAMEDGKLVLIQRFKWSDFENKSSEWTFDPSVQSDGTFAIPGCEAITITQDCIISSDQIIDTSGSYHHRSLTLTSGAKLRIKSGLSVVLQMDKNITTQNGILNFEGNSLELRTTMINFSNSNSYFWANYTGGVPIIFNMTGGDYVDFSYLELNKNSGGANSLSIYNASNVKISKIDNNYPTASGSCGGGWLCGNPGTYARNLTIQAKGTVYIGNTVWQGSCGGGVGSTTTNACYGGAGGEGATINISASDIVLDTVNFKAGCGGSIPNTMFVCEGGHYGGDGGKSPVLDLNAKHSILFNGTANYFDGGDAGNGINTWYPTDCAVGGTGKNMYLKSQLINFSAPTYARAGNDVSKHAGDACASVYGVNATINSTQIYSMPSIGTNFLSVVGNRYTTNANHLYGGSITLSYANLNPSNSNGSTGHLTAGLTANGVFTSNNLSGTSFEAPPISLSTPSNNYQVNGSMTYDNFQFTYAGANSSMNCSLELDGVIVNWTLANNATLTTISGTATRNETNVWDIYCVNGTVESYSPQSNIIFANDTAIFSVNYGTRTNNGTNYVNQSVQLYRNVTGVGSFSNCNTTTSSDAIAINILENGTTLVTNLGTIQSPMWACDFSNGGYYIIRWNENAVTQLQSNWIQDLTKTSNATTQYANLTVNFSNPNSNAVPNVTGSWACLSGFTCNILSNTTNVGANSNYTINISASGDGISTVSSAWSENLSATNNMSQVSINATAIYTDTSGISWTGLLTNVSDFTPCPLGFVCTIPTTYSLSALGSTTLHGTATNDTISEYLTPTNIAQYTPSQAYIHIGNTDLYLNYTIQINSTTNISLPNITINYNGDANFTITNAISTLGFTALENKTLEIRGYVPLTATKNSVTRPSWIPSVSYNVNLIRLNTSYQRNMTIHFDDTLPPYAFQVYYCRGSYATCNETTQSVWTGLAFGHNTTDWYLNDYLDSDNLSYLVAYETIAPPSGGGNPPPTNWATAPYDPNHTYALSDITTTLVDSLTTQQAQDLLDKLTDAEKEQLDPAILEDLNAKAGTSTITSTTTSNAGGGGSLAQTINNALTSTKEAIDTVAQKSYDFVLFGIPLTIKGAVILLAIIVIGIILLFLSNKVSNQITGVIGLVVLLLFFGAYGGLVLSGSAISSAPNITNINTTINTTITAFITMR